MHDPFSILDPCAGSFDKASILTVDDDPDIGIALMDFLKQEGYAVTVVETGQAAIEASTHHRFQAVILDLGLPDRDGLEVLTHLLDRDPGLPVIILTAYSPLERSPTKMEQSHAFASLSKPFDREKLKNTIRQALQTRPPIPEHEIP